MEEADNSSTVSLAKKAEENRKLREGYRKKFLSCPICGHRAIYITKSVKRCIRCGYVEDIIEEWEDGS